MVRKVGTGSGVNGREGGGGRGGRSGLVPTGWRDGVKGGRGMGRGVG